VVHRNCLADRARGVACGSTVTRRRDNRDQARAAFSAHARPTGHLARWAGATSSSTAPERQQAGIHVVDLDRCTVTWTGAHPRPARKAQTLAALAIIECDCHRAIVADVVGMHDDVTVLPGSPVVERARSSSHFNSFHVCSRRGPDGPRVALRRCRPVGSRGRGPPRTPGTDPRTWSTRCARCASSWPGQINPSRPSSSASTRTRATNPTLMGLPS